MFGPPVQSNYEKNYQLMNNSRALPPMPWQMPSIQQQMGATGNSFYGGGTSADYPYMDGGGGPTNASVVFDPNVLLASANDMEAVLTANGGNTQQDTFQFKISIDELDLWDMVQVHALSKNSPAVSAACGKWNAVTSVSPPSIPVMYVVLISLCLNRFNPWSVHRVIGQIYIGHFDYVIVPLNYV